MPSIFSVVQDLVPKATKVSSGATTTVSGIKTVTAALSNGVPTSVSQAIKTGQSGLAGAKDIANALGSREIFSQLGKVGTVLGRANQLNQSLGTLQRVLGGDQGGILDLLRGGLKGGRSAHSELTGPPNPFTAKHFLEEMLQRPDPLLSFEWVAVFNDPGNFRELIPSVYIEEVDTPTISLDKTQIHRAGTNISFAGVQSVSEVSVTLYSDRTGAAFHFASSWFNRTLTNSSGNFSLPKDYKKELVIYMFDVRRRVVVALHMHGVYPSNWDSYSLNASSDPLRTRLTLSVDSIEFEEVV